MSGALQEAVEVALLTYFYLPWLWGRADAVAWYLAKHISWFHHSEIWGELHLVTAVTKPLKSYRACLASCKVLQGQERSGSGMMSIV